VDILTTALESYLFLAVLSTSIVNIPLVNNAT